MSDDQHTTGPNLAAIHQAIEGDGADANTTSAKALRKRGRGQAEQAVSAPIAAAADAAPLQQPEPVAPLVADAEPAARPSPQETKDTPMTETTDTATTHTDAMAGMTGQVQERMQAFYQRSNTLLSEMSELGRGNVEAMVESGRILATGLQDLGRTGMDDTRTAFETATDGVKRMAAVKSPTELMQLQSELARRSFDAAVAQTSKNTEAMLKLANDMFAPVSTRMSVTAEKLSAAA